MVQQKDWMKTRNERLVSGFEMGAKRVSVKWRRMATQLLLDPNDRVCHFSRSCFLFFTMPDPTESSKQCARFPLAEYLDGTRPFDDNTPTIDMRRLKERKA